LAFLNKKIKMEASLKKNPGHMDSGGSPNVHSEDNHHLVGHRALPAPLGLLS
jgi:hypothetical protein